MNGEDNYEGVPMTVTTLDPTCSGASGPVTATGARASKAELELAPRPATLDGATIGIVMNRLADCELMFDALYEELSRRDDVAGVIKVNKDSQAVPPTPEQWAEIEKADVVITGFGGCGSCSTRSMRDALDLEAKGIPAVSVVHTALVPAVRVIAEIAGRPDYEIVTVDYPHPPVAAWPKDEAQEIARDIADAVRQRLVTAV
jgi:hypothetical protein